MLPMQEKVIGEWFEGVILDLRFTHEFLGSTLPMSVRRMARRGERGLMVTLTLIFMRSWLSMRRVYRGMLHL